MAPCKEFIASLLLVAGLMSLVVGDLSFAGRIIGGRYASIEEFPFMAAVYKGDDDTPQCSASILTRTALLTVSHCVADKNASAYQLIVGITNTSEERHHPGKGQTRRVVKIERHPNKDHDAAVVIVDKPFMYNSAVRPLTFASLDKDKLVKHMHKLQAANTPCWSAGWGFTAKGVYGMSDKLKAWPATILTSKQCAHAYCTKQKGVQERHCKPAHYDKTFQICASSPKAIGCLGDSGNPLVCDGNIVGMTGWMYDCNVGTPVTFVDIRPLFDVAKKYICELTRDYPSY